MKSPLIPSVLRLQMLLAFGAALVFHGCSTSEGTAKQPPTHYLSVLRSESDFALLEGKPLSSKFSHIGSVKVIYDLRDKRLYFINSHLYKYHYDFAERMLRYDKSLYEFNGHNYSADETLTREYLLGNLNRIKNKNTYFLELSPSDQMDLRYVNQLYAEVKKNCAHGDSLLFYANNPRLLQAAENGHLTLPLITSERLFGTVPYQQVSPGKTYGILRKYTLEELKTRIPDRNEIIVIDGTPLTLPDVKGIIVTELQTPLSHLVLLGRNRNIPIAAYPGGWNDETLNGLLGKKVLFGALEDSLQLTENLAVELENQERPTLTLKADYGKTGLIHLDKVPVNGMDYVGSKAYNFSCLAAISRKKGSFRVPEHAFAIPFFYYKQHLLASGAAESVLRLQRGALGPEEVRAELKKIRKRINAHPLDNTLRTMVENELAGDRDFNSFRFRSSTNAEDLGDFNGAGLYDSKSAVLGDTGKTVEEAIKKVWASVWSEAAYNEREIFNISQGTVAMGILVHRSFPEEMANGVVITENIYRETEGITVNVQKGESSVVLPEKGVGTEIFAAYRYEQPPWNGQLVVDYTSHSPLNDYKPILTHAEMEKLFGACRDIDVGMYRYWQRDAVCDIEFKLVGEKRELYIKQVRIY